MESITSKLMILMLLSIVFASGCKKDVLPVEPDPTPYEVYISHNYVATYSASSIKNMYSTLQIAYPYAAALTDKVHYDVNVYKVIYKTSFKGDEVDASGLVCVPLSSSSALPMISFQNGTNTSHAEAPTKDLGNPMFQYLHAAASMGYIMLIPDYLGFGASEQMMHPYLHKKSTVASVENLITATREMITDSLIKVKWNNDLYLMGYSQGGWSTLCTHYDINKVSSLPFKVKASVCGAGPYNLSVVQNFMFENITYPMPVYMAYLGVAYQHYDLVPNPLTDFFNQPYADNLPSYFNGQYTNQEINEMLNDTVEVLIAPSFFNGISNDPAYEDFRRAMADNSISGWNTDVPIRLYHGTSDIYVPKATSEQVYQEFVNAGASNVSYFPLDGLDHSTAAAPTIIKALLWFNDMEGK